MDLALATAWQPRGEFGRFLKLLPRLQEAYRFLAITLPPEAPPDLVQILSGLPGVRPAVTPAWPQGRSLALRLAWQTETSHVQYVDFDRLLHWVETRPEEWLATARAVGTSDCLVAGRTPDCYATHPQALVQSEAISNAVVSHYLDRWMDVSAGCKGFSRRAAGVLVREASQDRPFATDAEWPLLLQKAGYRIEYCEVEGLDWESADRYQDRAAGRESQALAAAAYDADPQHWAMRLKVAAEIIEAALSCSGA